MQELIVLELDRLEELKSRIAGKLAVVQEITPRMVVVEGDPERVRSVSGIPGVTPSQKIERSRLSPSETLFVEAWSQRKASDDMRKFNGLNWGTTGFEAP